MGRISVKTHKFVRGKALRDGKCLYWSALKVFKQKISCARNEGLRMLIADWIRNNRELRIEAVRSGTEYRTINEYCLAIEKGILWGGPPELLALSEIFEIVICLIYVTKSQGDISIWPIFYGEKNPLATTYVCILYDGKHYDPLYVINTENISDEETVFERNNTTVKELLKNFIQEEFEYENNINLDILTPVVVEEVSSEMNGIDSQEFQKISSSVVQDVSVKRKADECDTIAFGQDNQKQILFELPEKYYVSNKRVKSSATASGRISTFDSNDTNAMTIEKLLQTNMFDSKPDDELMEQTSSNECSIISIDANQTQEKKYIMPSSGLNDQ
ncbi:unnamed protein product [Rotaria socialis]|uniref:Ubiquitin thioesterase OTU n=1 Tax=Rotaria socialis TaxID=392032 RepID=A0A818N382_9BILA|nr:unnamed protein product [Rotaria socialis]CAF4385518.1 unnamed protein product [Rotaria socialis]